MKYQSKFQKHFCKKWTELNVMLNYKGPFTAKSTLMNIFGGITLFHLKTSIMLLCGAIETNISMKAYSLMEWNRIQCLKIDSYTCGSDDFSNKQGNSMRKDS